MIIKTSRFANVGEFRSHETPISISRWSPSWYFGKSLHLLAPPGELVKATKAGEIDQEMYTDLFKEFVLDPLDPQETLDVIQSYGDNPILMCYEDLTIPGEWCHRRLVADWLEDNLGLEVPEWTKQDHLKTILRF